MEKIDTIPQFRSHQWGSLCILLIKWKKDVSPFEMDFSYVGYTSIKLLNRCDLHDGVLLWNCGFFFHILSCKFPLKLVLSLYLILDNSLSIFYHYYSYLYKKWKMTVFAWALKLFSLGNAQGIFCIVVRKSSVSVYLEVLKLCITLKDAWSLVKSCCPLHIPEKLTRFRLNMSAKFIISYEQLDEAQMT